MVTLLAEAFIYVNEWLQIQHEENSLYPIKVYAFPYHWNAS